MLISRGEIALSMHAPFQKGSAFAPPRSNVVCAPMGYELPPEILASMEFQMRTKQGHRVTHLPVFEGPHRVVAVVDVRCILAARSLPHSPPAD